MTPAPTPDEQPARPHRLSLSQILEMMLARSPRDHSSVTLSRNAKGETQIEVVVRTDETSGLATVDQAAEKASELYDGLRRQFPLASGFVGAQPEKP